MTIQELKNMGLTEETLAKMHAKVLDGMRGGTFGSH